MRDARPTNRPKQVVAWIFTLLFADGFFVPAVGCWTGPVLSVWFAGTQRTKRGFLWMMAFCWLPTLLFHLRGLLHGGTLPALCNLLWTLPAAALIVLPYSFHRLVAPHLPEFSATLALPTAGVALYALAQEILPPSTASLFYLAYDAQRYTLVFLHLWLASALLYAWDHEFHWEIIHRTLTQSALCAMLALAIGWLTAIKQLHFLRIADPLLWLSVGGAALLALWAWLRPTMKEELWKDRTETLARLQSPTSGASLRLVEDAHGEALMSATNERFPIHNDIAEFVRPDAISGANKKYNQLYQTIGGFYDDSQRVGSALIGMDRDAYVRSYLDRLEVKPGDAVLETSVGTGLNFKYLPEGVKLTGLDLSSGMLTRCQENLRRWRRKADLFLGNAEFLPFADNSFDVVFHVGGINFFSDRKRAIDEMIRVAKPGSLLLIADETEEHVQKAYENIPYTQEFYKKREEVVSAPVDLLPPEMEEVKVEAVWGNRFYALTFRKPLAEAPSLRQVARDGAASC